MCSFSIEGVGDVACPISDIKFIIAICLPLCRLLNPTRASHRTLFALTIATAVARKCVEIKKKHATGTGTPLDDFWREIILSTKSANQPLWEEAIVNSIHDQVRNWVFLKAREHVAECLFQHERDFGPVTGSSAEPVQESELQGSIESTFAQSALSLTGMQTHSTTLGEKERNSAASIVAWLEFFGPNQVASSLTLWDTTWSSTWDKEWGKVWIESWTNHQGENDFKVATHTQFTDHIPVTTGRVSGKIAGKIPIDTNVMFELMVKMPVNSLLEWEYDYTKHFRNCQGNKGAETATTQGKEVAWFKSWRCLRYPNPLDSWCPSWELAVVMAWVLRWEKAVEAGQLEVQKGTHRGTNYQRIVAGPVTVSPTGSQEQVSSAAPHAGGRAPTGTVEPRAPPTKSKYSRNKLMATTRLLGQMKARYLKRVFEQPNITNQIDQVSRSCQGNPPCLLDKVVDSAWDIALKTPESPESNLSSTAANAFHLTKKNFGIQLASHIAALPKNDWELVFKKAWQETWKKCWREAWAAVMKEAEKVAFARGQQEGMSCTRDDEDRKLAQQVAPSQPSIKPMFRLEPTVILSHKAQASLGIIERKMLHTNLPVDYRRCVPSIFISLEQLYRAMSHSSPVVHPKMEIKMFDSEEKPLLQAIVYAKSKTKALWEHKLEEESFQIVSHADFQSKVKRMIEDISETPDQDFDQPATKLELMAEVWQEAIAISSSIDWDFIPEVSEPKSAFKTLPLRGPTRYSSQRAVEIGSGREFKEGGSRRNRDSVINRIFIPRKEGL
ncbi:unnamed protein product [Rhizoctonia solani]|uniref:Uncharacterized protein n=1 Tax=Rhizoctonia solani TaxID=456999 RepID=A0A8H2WWY8_9AGAM|nr:unnamed protein product [Rhizoctonia solani]